MDAGEKYAKSSTEGGWQGLTQEGHDCLLGKAGLDLSVDLTEHPTTQAALSA